MLQVLFCNHSSEGLTGTQGLFVRIRCTVDNYVKTRDKGRSFQAPETLCCCVVLLTLTSRICMATSSHEVGNSRQKLSNKNNNFLLYNSF